MTRWDLTTAWGRRVPRSASDPRFGELAGASACVDYWKQYGFPDGCRAGDDTPVVCS